MWRFSRLFTSTIWCFSRLFTSTIWCFCRLFTSTMWCFHQLYAVAISIPEDTNKLPKPHTEERDWEAVERGWLMSPHSSLYPSYSQFFPNSCVLTNDNHRHRQQSRIMFSSCVFLPTSSSVAVFSVHLILLQLT